MAVIDKTSSYMEFPLQISRQYAAPIDRFSVFYTYDEALAYASTNAIAYVGQIISVVDATAGTTTAYVISNTAGDLIEVGSGNAAPMIFVTDEAAMLALEDIEVGQQVYREDIHTIWIFKGVDATDLDNWVESAAASDTVWKGTENKIIFYSIAQTAYDQLTIYDANTLYFTDAGRIYKGAADMTASVVVSADLASLAPSAAIADKLYINPDTVEIKLTHDNATWLTLLPGYLTDGGNWASADSNKLATVGLIKSGIQESLEQFVEDATAFNATFEKTAGTVTVGNGTGATLSGVAHGITYDASTLTITVPCYGEDDLVINIPKDKFVTAGKFYEKYPENDPIHENVIVLTIDNQDDPVIIPAASLVNIYEADNTNKNLVVTIEDNKVSAQLLIDPDSKNALTFSDAGFLVDVSNKLDKLDSAVGQKILLSNTDGTIDESEISIQLADDLTDSSSEIAVNAVIYRALATKYAIVQNATVGNIVTFGADNTLADSGFTLGGESFGEAASTTIATEAGVVEAINSARLQWQTF